jgi:hypothetical protein
MQPQAPQSVPEQKVPRKSLKLSDDEILGIYHSAQVEAAIEADWRGISGPAVPGSGGEGPARSARSAASQAQGGDQEYLRMLSRALQEPGRSPRALTAEILDPSKGAVCCHPGVPGMMHSGAGIHSPALPGTAGSSHRVGPRDDQP